MQGKENEMNMNDYMVQFLLILLFLLKKLRRLGNLLGGSSGTASCFSRNSGCGKSICKGRTCGNKLFVGELMLGLSLRRMGELATLARAVGTITTVRLSLGLSLLGFGRLCFAFWRMCELAVLVGAVSTIPAIQLLSISLLAFSRLITQRMGILTRIVGAEHSTLASRHDFGCRAFLSFNSLLAIWMGKLAHVVGACSSELAVSERRHCDVFRILRKRWKIL
jgi:hypothetical protein